MQTRRVRFALVVLTMEDVESPKAKAYIAPENVAEPLRYSGYVAQSDGRLEFSPAFDSLSAALAWARERTDFVIARGVSGPYYWYGVGPSPRDITAPPE